MLDPASLSPCVKNCSLDANGCCQGCYRTIDEIVRWRSMSEIEQRAVLRRLRDLTPATLGAIDACK